MRVHWSKNARESLQERKKAENGYKDFGSAIAIKDIFSVAKGKTTEVFQRSVAKQAPEDQCFSIITKDRTLDLLCGSKSERDLWVDALRAVSNPYNM